MSGSHPASEAGPSGTERSTSGKASTNARVEGRATKPPGPSGWPIVGNTLQFVRDPFGFYDELASYGDVVRYRVAGLTFTTLLHPDHVERVLVGESHRFERYNFDEFAVDFASEGLLRSKGEQWRRQRELIQPAFTPAKVAAFADSMVDRTVETVDGWDEGETIAANRVFSELTLDVLTKTLFDLDLDDRRAAITRGAREINARADSRRLTAMIPTWVPTPRNRRYRRTMAQFDAVVEALIAERRSSDENRNDLLSMLLAATDDDRSLSDAEIRDQLVTFLFAGHETSSLALTYAFLLLSQHDDVRRTLDDELASVCGDRDPTVDDVPHLEYTKQVIDETMRLYPPAYVLFRVATEDVTFDGYLVPEGTKLTLPQFRLHMDERWWDDPDEFRPERWTAARQAERPEYAYFPFGGGPRHCVGMRFATMELTLVLATIARRVRFDLVSDPDPDVRVGATLAPASDVELRVRKRA